MVVNARMKKVIFLVWLLMVPAGMWFTYHTYPPNFSGQWLDLIAFLLLTLVVASMPMVINNTPIFLIQWVSLATFLSFGLFVEMVFAQAAVIVLLLKLRIQKDQLFRLPLNFIMFFLVSLISGAVYYLLGGKTGPELISNPHAIWLAATYAVLNYFLNQVIVSFYLYFIYKSKGSYFGKDFIVETITTLITLPLGIVLYMLYNQGGLLPLLLVGIPFVSLSIIFNLYYSSEKVNAYLQQAAEIGHQMAERLEVNGVLDLLIEKLSEMLPVDYGFIFDVVNEDELHLVRSIKGKCKELPLNMPRIKKNEGISGYVWSKGKAHLYSTSKQWKRYSTGYIPSDAESVLAVPIVRNKKVIGVVMLASKRKRAYEKYQLMIVDILCSYFAVAMENAKHYEITKMQSEHCALTKLYNYRYFEKLLTEEFNKLYQFERRVLSLIILDIDHFKAVNDTYGHQSGNEILIELADRLSKIVGSRGTVARYGGEEFVVLLPEGNKEEAYQMAEMIRQAIANWPFTLQESLELKQHQVKITASIGVATAPEDAEDPLALVRHADRALYVGAKRAGRNRVAEYSSC
ncbi:sensor domain-containing diguanylate cyclase [Bacillus sp. OK048]|uniref:sensor domain-containing diguanylate cyclase n=1 Tax=Bacillus sp. OK048 TaxID=1882761 RepID=UPI00088A4752|nr:sensor domain-containing diguanylate cyclase [Bacillus sp. OK048]SDM23811.1 diguanylate cyclase (GGDEF) domain-containing protein [Bacillus sp. OK048]